MEASKVKYTSVINKYPSFRNETLFGGNWEWLHGRRADDGAEGLWRVHDKLYDLKDFVAKHPGGKEWLVMTEGTDITESFEAYHIKDTAKQVLSKYYAREAVQPRNYRFTYDEKGFFKTLQRRIAERVEKLDKRDLWKSKFLLDSVVVALFLTSILAVRAEKGYASYFMTSIAGWLLAMIFQVGHNFIHQRNNIRMYAVNLLPLGFRDIRLAHAISHHLYPNTYADLEVSSYELIVKWLPVFTKSTFYKVICHVFMLTFFMKFMHFAFISRIRGLFMSSIKIFHWDELIGLSLPLAMFAFGGASFGRVFVVYNCMILIMSFIVNFFGKNAGHHGPTITHEGDEFRSLDFGAFQLGATIDRYEANINHWVVISSFGEHIIHHLFPSLDHALLPQLKGTLIETCKEFELELREIHFLDAFIGQYQQSCRSETIKL